MRRWLTRLTMMGIGLLAAGLAAELLVTVVYGKQVRFPRHVVRASWGTRFNQPNASYGHHSPDIDVRFEINAQGMRADVDYDYAKPAGVKRVICLGDSFTMGYEVENDQCFARLLERGLEERGVRCQVLNAGVSGFGSAEALIYLERELLKYDPDAVVLSFFINDLDDNVRSALFKLEDGVLVADAQDYVPMDRFGDFLNTNWVMSALSEHSNAFAMAKETMTRLLKKNIVDQHLANIEAADGKAGAGQATDAVAKKSDVQAPADYQARLGAAILDRLYQVCHSHGLPLVIQSIPVIQNDNHLVDVFPIEHFDTRRPDLVFIACTEFLASHAGKELLYYERSHLHWTPFAHRLSAQRLTEALAPLLR